MSSQIRGLLGALHQAAFRFAMRLIELELVPDFITRAGIRHLLSIRLRDVRICNLVYSVSSMFCRRPLLVRNLITYTACLVCLPTPNAALVTLEEVIMPYHWHDEQGACHLEGSAFAPLVSHSAWLSSGHHGMPAGCLADSDSASKQASVC
jgi:hypothetical protein